MNDQQYQSRARRLLVALERRPMQGTRELVLSAAMNVTFLRRTVVRMLAEGLVVQHLSPSPKKGPHLKQYEMTPEGATFLADGQPRETERMAARTDPSLHTHGAPTGFALRGASTLLNAEGQVVQQWVKTKTEDQGPEALLEAFSRAVASRDLPAYTPRPFPPSTPAIDLLAVYPMGDPHMGLLSWPLETGEDFNLDIAERVMFDCVDKLVSLAPPCEQALIINLGDFFHADNLSGTTTRSGHKLDVDGRWAKVLQVGISTMVRIVNRALQKHATVRVINEIGNHDDHSSMMLSVCLANHYRNESRVVIDCSPSTFHWHEFGRVLIGTTHGHNTKAAALPGIMAHDQAEAWGRTHHRFWYCGHIHHERKIEFPGCLVEHFRTTAAKDAWSHSKGYRAQRSMVLDVMHIERGRITRHECGVEEVRGGL